MSNSSSSSVLEWWKSAVFYQIYPRSFYDANNDGIGDLPGIIAKLDYLNDGRGGGLGIDAIWISPFFPSPMKDFGYDVSDYVGVDPMFGNMADFERLVAEAHKRGIKVVIDLVLNHTSDIHPWFVESRRSRDNAQADWYVWRDAPQIDGPPNNWLSVFGGPAWTFCEKRGQYYMHSFLKEQPDVNWYNPQLREEIRKVLRFWASKGVDGYRLDTANFFAYDREFKDNPPTHPDLIPVEKHLADFNRFSTINSKDRPENFEFLELIRSTMDATGKDMTTIGEIGGIEDPERLASLSASYVNSGRHLHMAYNFGLLASELTPEHVATTVGRLEKHIGTGWPCWSLGNHDCKRVATRAESTTYARSLQAMLLCLRGTPILYYGDEIDMPEYDIKREEMQDPFGIRLYPDFKGRDGCRTPFAWDVSLPSQGFNAGSKPWLPATAPIGLSTEVGRRGSTFNLLKELLLLRRSSSALLQGSYECLEQTDDRLCFSRKHGKEEVWFMLNSGIDVATFALPAKASLVMLKQQNPAPVQKGSAVEIAPQSFAIVKVSG